MTGKADFTPEQWELVLEGPPSAAMIVITAQRGGTLRETLSMAKTYAQARQSHGQSELLDEIVAAKPKIDHTRFHSYDELKQHGLAHLRDAVALLEAKATPEEVTDYKRFAVSLASNAAAAHRERGHDDDAVSESERAALSEIEQALSASG